MSERIFNFSAGPAVLPVPVLEEAQRDMLSLPGVGMSVMEISHRSKTFDEIIGNAERGMPGFTQLNDASIAAIATHVRNSWGNAFDPVAADEVAGYRPPPG